MGGGCLARGAGLGGGQGQTGAGGWVEVQPAASTMKARTSKRMWVIYLEVVLALGLAIFIVWFTWPRKK